MAQPNHLRLVVDNTNGDRGEIGTKYNPDIIAEMMGRYFQVEDFRAMKMKCIEIGNMTADNGYWEFVDREYKYFSFLFDAVPRDERYEQNVMTANFFMQTVYLSFLALIVKKEPVISHLQEVLEGIPADIRRLSDYHAFNILIANTKAANHIDLPREDEKIQTFVANRTTELLSS